MTDDEIALLRIKLRKVEKQVEELAARIWQLKDELYTHTHPELAEVKHDEEP